MNRTLTMLLTVALLGSLMFMGFAGTAAANDDGQSNNADIYQGQSVYQSADASSEGSFAIAVDLNDDNNDDGPTANTGNSVVQDSENDQGADIDQTNENIEGSVFLGLEG